MPTKPVLQLDQVTKQFSNLEAVSNLTLEVYPGEIYALIGPNGAGKTTTVKMISGLIEPTHGTINIGGHNSLENPVESKQLLGYIPDEPFVYPYLTGKEFIEFVGDIYGLSRKETHRRATPLLEHFNLSSIINGLFANYSRGNKQKVVIIATLIHRPKLLVIDEPIVGLDVESQQTTKQLFLNFAQQGGAILLCTHTLTVAQEIANRIGIFDQGKLLAEGSYTELKRTYKITSSLESIYLRALKTK